MQHSLGCFSTLQYQKIAFLSANQDGKHFSRHNEPLYNEILSITNDTLQPGQSYGMEKNLDITNLNITNTI